MKTVEWEMPDKTRCTVVRLKGLFSAWNTVDDEPDKVREDEVYDIPPNWKELTWYLLSQSPCLWGDDVVIAYDKEAKVAYAIFDLICNSYNWDLSLEAFIVQNAVDPELLDRYRRHDDE